MHAHITARGLTKTYHVREKKKGLAGSLKSWISSERKDIVALDDVSFTISAGELVGYIGPNGAGKSTTIKILSGILVPDSGTCLISGLVPWKQRIAHVARIGVVFGQRSQLWWDLPPCDSFELIRDIYRLDSAEFTRTLDNLVMRMDAAGIMNTPVRQMSLGQRMRCELIASLLHKPELLFLDEPTIGLDAMSKRAIREIVRDINKENGVTVILTTHDMDDIEALCQRVMIIGSGKILSDSSVDALRDGFPKRRIEAQINMPRTREIPFNAAITSENNNRITLEFDPADVSSESIILWLSENCGLKDVTIEHQRIEDIIAAVYERLDG